MKQLSFLFICLLLHFFVTAQSGQWTWIHGDSTGNNMDVIGQINVPDTANKPGSIIPFNTWKDNDGNFWMFGGRTLIKRFGTELIPVSSNQLWKYSPFINTWTLVKGANGQSPDDDDAEGVYGIKEMFAPSNTPPKFRNSSALWTDTAGNFWLFGGKIGYRDFGSKNDLWEFDPLKNQWRWVSGAGPAATPFSGEPYYGIKGVPDSLNHPGARSDMLYWQDSNDNFYLYGGVRDITHTVYSDLWKYQPSNKRWTWIGGNQWIPGASAEPVYGIKGVPEDNNTPGALSLRSNDLFSWTDPLGKLWIYFNTELWYYLPATNQWAWIDGDRRILPKRKLGTKGISSQDNHPGSRYEFVRWADTSGNLWIYGGHFDISPGNYCNDLWKYNLVTGQWTWMGGDSSLNRLPDFGIKGTTSVTNQPGSRSSSKVWTDSNGDFWLFGGKRQSLQPGPLFNYTLLLNDLWKLDMPDNIGLAIKLQKFSAMGQNGQAVLNWITSFEQNSKEFLIQYSTDGSHFTTIATVAASNSALGSHYHFVHREIAIGNNFYRLQLVNTDGTVEYSSIANVFIKKESFSYAIIQNLSQRELTIEMQAEQVTTLEIVVSNVSGHILSRERKTIARGRSIHVVPVSQLSAGTYFISIIKDKKVTTKRFFKY